MLFAKVSMQIPRRKIHCFAEKKNCTALARESPPLHATRLALGYTRLDMRWFVLVLVSFFPPILSQASPPAQVSTQALETGKILSPVPCVEHPEFSYALYLPSHYSSSHRWPLVVSSDPGARGSAPLELQKDAAERYGYILAASNDSRNGPWKPLLEATKAMLIDLQTRLSIDTNRVYFAGFSGGARASTQIAAQCKCAAGILLSGAGFSRGVSLASLSSIPVFSAVGNLDFNYSEVIPLQESLARANHPHWLRIFEGSHQWAPAEVMEEALAWFRSQVMKTQREAPDQAFIRSQFSTGLARAESFQQSGDLLSAWREYLQIAGTYDSLVDVAAVHAKVSSLGRDKTVQDALKREHAQFEEQAKLTNDITARLAALPDRDDTRLQTDQDLQGQLLRLRHNAEQEKRLEKTVVYKRALSGVFIGAMEIGNAFVEDKKFSSATRVYGFATQAKPDSEWAWGRLAAAEAFAGDRKQAIAALRHAESLTKDKPAFQKWLQSEHAFDPLRSNPDFQVLAQ